MWPPYTGHLQHSIPELFIIDPSRHGPVSLGRTPRNKSLHFEAAPKLVLLQAPVEGTEGTGPIHRHLFKLLHSYMGSPGLHLVEAYSCAPVCVHLEVRGLHWNPRVSVLSCPTSYMVAGDQNSGSHALRCKRFTQRACLSPHRACILTSNLVDSRMSAPPDWQSQQ